MKQIHDYPPNIEDIRAVFPLRKGIVFTYGDTLYNPSGGHIDSDLEAHESTHASQQSGNPKEWWDKYLKDPSFRFTQELEAYRTQYQNAKNREKDRNSLAKFARLLASDLASPMYGNITTFSEAYRLITTLL